MQDATQKRFLWAVVLAWTPWAPTVIALMIAFQGISNSKATGIGAVAGGVGEVLATWGIIAMIISQGVAIVWLFRSFSRDHWTRNFVAAVSIGLSGLILLMVGFFLWMVWFQMPRH